MLNSRFIPVLLALSASAAMAQGGPPGGRATTVESTVIQPTSLSSTVHAVGTILADASAMLRTELPGQIVGLHFEDGQPIGKGDPLFSIEDTVLRAQDNEAKANVAQSESAYIRAQELINDKLISASDFDAAQAEHNVNVARLLSSRAILSKTVIRSPMDGFVGLRKINVGDYATTGQELVDVVRLDPLRVEFSVPETLLAQMKPGQGIEVSVGAYPDEIFAGEITAIAPQIDVTGHSVAIRGRLPNPELKLRPGLFAQVSVTLDINPKALMVPEQAIWPIGQQKTVYIVEDGKAVQKFVRLGKRNPGSVEVLSGIVAGDEVITAGQMKIFDGAEVKTIPATGIGD